MIIPITPETQEKLRELTHQRIESEIDVRRIELPEPPLLSIDIDGFTTWVTAEKADPEHAATIAAVYALLDVIANSTRPEDIIPPEEPEEPEEPEGIAQTAATPVPPRPAPPQRFPPPRR